MVFLILAHYKKLREDRFSYITEFFITMRLYPQSSPSHNNQLQFDCHRYICLVLHLFHQLIRFDWYRKSFITRRLNGIRRDTNRYGKYSKRKYSNWGCTNYPKEDVHKFHHYAYLLRREHVILIIFFTV